MTGVIL